MWFEQVDELAKTHLGVSHSGFISAKPNLAHQGFTVSAPQIASRNLAIADGMQSSAIFQAMSHLSFHDKALARDAHVEAMADILMENRHQVPKKPIYVTHLRTHQWYIDLFKLKAPLH